MTALLGCSLSVAERQPTGRRFLIPETAFLHANGFADMPVEIHCIVKPLHAGTKTLLLQVPFK